MPPIRRSSGDSIAFATLARPELEQHRVFCRRLPPKLLGPFAESAFRIATAWGCARFAAWDLGSSSDAADVRPVA